MTYIQKDFMRDFVFPVCTFKNKNLTNSEIEFDKFLGTAFLIGDNGFALTASHVIENFHHELAGMFVNEDLTWQGFHFEKIEHHPSEDVCLLKIFGGKWKSPFKLSNDKIMPWKDYLICGYPLDVLHEDKSTMDEYSRIPPRPDMIHAKGYIRRRISRNLEISGVRGTNFFELSSIAGKGCSGGPLFEIHGECSEVLGIYVGETDYYLNNDIEGIKYIKYSMAYATRVEAFRDWVPKTLGKPLKEEFSNFYKK